VFNIRVKSAVGVFPKSQSRKLSAKSVSGSYDFDYVLFVEMLLEANDDISAVAEN